tara:strand:- start:3926 stop:4141 length:216 start_codon:yes stop_codon:yes gene_type:complete
MIAIVAKRLVATFIAAGVPNVLAGAIVDVAVWKSAVMAGCIAALGAVQTLATAYKADGELTNEDVESAFKN